MATGLGSDAVMDGAGSPIAMGGQAAAERLQRIPASSFPP
jgi:hypothetical protein